MNAESNIEGQETVRQRYLSIRIKFCIALLVALTWMTLSIWLSQRWMLELGAVTHPVFALIAISFIAYVPGFMNAFLLASILLDKRPERRPQTHYPGVSILIAAYQEEKAIAGTLECIAAEDYPGEVEVLVLNDGSTDRTVEIARETRSRLTLAPGMSIEILSSDVNQGKASTLNRGLAHARHDLIVTIDGDSELRRDSLRRIVERLQSDPPNTQAVAGAVLVGNSRENLLTGAQEWDYFHGIAAVKRMQSMYHGTLVAQGAFSIYRRGALEAVGGFPECVGEDIVITWAMLRKGYRVGYAEDAIIFTDAPETFRQFAQQRRRWSRGLVEALNHHDMLLFTPRLTLLFVWWNLLFLPLDLVYTFVFVPGLVLAMFGIFWIAGPLTLAVLPLAALWNIVIFRTQNRMLKRDDFKIRHNRIGFIFYVLVYSVLMQPICVWGYASELFGQRKKWGTK